jgi:succinate-semialdehyde dehydrogenase/glutarate-semialdehyde dehydrogenase
MKYQRGKIISLNPITHEELGEVDNWDLSMVQKAVDKARTAFPKWSALSFKERGQMLLTIRDHIYQNIEEIVGIVSKEIGKPRVEVLISDIVTTLYFITYIINHAEKILKSKKIPLSWSRLLGKKSLLLYKPRGVVGIIVPWNYPFFLAISEMISALISGNCVIMKPSEYMSLTAKKIEQIFQSIGLPEGVVSVIYGDKTTVETMIYCNLDFITFTGSTQVGKNIMKLASNFLTPLTMELGGKDPMIVLNDADIEVASSGALWGAFSSAGQMCGSVEIVCVQQSVAENFVNAIIKKAKKLQQDNNFSYSTDIGSMGNKQQFIKVKNLVEEAVRNGATILWQGPCNQGDGYFYPPTILGRITPDMKLMREEIFGPILPIIIVKDETEAIQLANSSTFGLSASIWTSDLKRGKRIAEYLNTGTVMINDHIFAGGMPESPWGGIKDSGFGKVHGEKGLMKYVRSVHVCVDYFYQIKKPWWFPYNRKLYDLLSQFSIFFTSKKWLEKFLALPSMVRLLFLRKL